MDAGRVAAACVFSCAGSSATAPTKQTTHATPKMIGPGPIAGDEGTEGTFDGECEGASERDDALAVRVFIASRRVAVFLRAGVLFAFLAVDFFSRTGGLLE